MAMSVASMLLGATVTIPTASRLVSAALTRGHGHGSVRWVLGVLCMAVVSWVIKL